MEITDFNYNFDDVDYITFKVPAFKLVNDENVIKYVVINKDSNKYNCSKCQKEFHSSKLLYKHIYYWCEVIKLEWIENFFDSSKKLQVKYEKLQKELTRIKEDNKTVLNGTLLQEIKRLKEELFNTYKKNDELENKIKNIVGVYEHNICLIHKSKDETYRRLLKEIENLKIDNKITQLKNSTLELDTSASVLTSLNKNLYNSDNLKIKILKHINYEWLEEYLSKQKLNYYVRGLDELVRGLIQGPLKKCLFSSKVENILTWKDENGNVVKDKGGLQLSEKILDLLVSYIGEHYREVISIISDMKEQNKATPGINHMYDLFKNFKENTISNMYKVFGGYLIKFSLDEI
jgi:hypothetical protein